MPHTYFFALFPDDIVRDRIIAAADALQLAQALNGRRVVPARLHLAAHFVGRYRQARSRGRGARDRGRRCVTRAPFEMALDRAYSFPRDRGEAPGVFVPSGVPAALHSFATQLRDGWRLLRTCHERAWRSGRTSHGYTPRIALWNPPSSRSGGAYPNSHWLTRYRVSSDIRFCAAGRCANPGQRLAACPAARLRRDGFTKH
jgi:hypothetical protein